MSVPRLDLSGRQFGRWTVLDWAGRSVAGKNLWRCRCDCGQQGVIQVDSLRSGTSTSCGCFRAEQLTAHGHAAPRSGEYAVWRGIKGRCYNPHAPGYASVGGRGIRMSAAWRDDFSRFLADMGPRPSPAHRLRRLNPARPYTNTNCVWVRANRDD